METATQTPAAAPAADPVTSIGADFGKIVLCYFFALLVPMLCIAGIILRFTGVAGGAALPVFSRAGVWGVLFSVGFAVAGSLFMRAFPRRVGIGGGSIAVENLLQERRSLPLAEVSAVVIQANGSMKGRLVIKTASGELRISGAAFGREKLDRIASLLTAADGPCPLARGTAPVVAATPDPGLPVSLKTALFLGIILLGLLKTLFTLWW
jgi:hypothetical protein